MAYLRQTGFGKRVFNPLAMRLGMAGSTALEVPRRRTGEPQRIPVIPVEVDGATYVVSTRGESDWVRNLRAAGGGTLGGRPLTATELPVEERAPVIDAYREQAGRTVKTYWERLPDPRDHPVFRIEPAGT